MWEVGNKIYLSAVEFLTKLVYDEGKRGKILDGDDVEGYIEEVKDFKKSLKIITD